VKKIQKLNRIIRAAVILGSLAYVAYNLNKVATSKKPERVIVKLVAEGDAEGHEEEILKKLGDRMGEVYIDDSGRKLYAVTFNEKSERLLLTIAGPDFGSMTPGEVSTTVMEIVEAMMSEQ